MTEVREPYRITHADGKCFTVCQVPTGEEVELDFLSLQGPWGRDVENYRYEAVELTKDSIVVDIGAYLGEYCEKISNKYQCKIYAYEPIEEYYNKIAEMVDNNTSMANVFPRKLAISNKTGKEDIIISNAGSAFAKYNKDLRGGTKVTIETLDVVEALESILKENETEEIDLVKINIEGAEFDLFPVLFDSKLISKIKNIHVQFHAFADDSYFKYLTIKQEMLKTHNVVLDSLWKWTFWTRKEDD